MQHNNTRCARAHARDGARPNNIRVTTCARVDPYTHSPPFSLRRDAMTAPDPAPAPPAMDASTLSALIDSSSADLAALHARLGSPPDRLATAIEALKASIHEAIGAQVRHLQADVDRVQEECTALEATTAGLARATGTPTGEPPSPTVPLLERRAALQAEEARLREEYARACTRVDALLAEVAQVNARMSHACPLSSNPGHTLGDAQLRDVSPATAARIEAHLERARQTCAQRRMQLEVQLAEILQLWSELCTCPKVILHAGRAIASEGTEESEFHAAILQYAQQAPAQVGDAFDGTFVPQTADTESECLHPTDEVMHASVALRTALEREKSDRENAIQAIYDELCELWMRFDVPEEEMDAFVLDHRGSTLSVVAAYRSELDKMRALKSQHMSLFIARTREQIQEQWDALFMSEEERVANFPAFHIELPEGTDAAFDWDALLAEHERMTVRLAEQLERRAPILRLLSRYREICDEARMLEESAHDTSRLLGRGNRGDPGRLLREEKMRKRVKIQKPRLENEMLKIVPQWEKDEGMPFIMDGVRLVDYLNDQLGGAKENTRARPARDEKARPQRPVVRQVVRRAPLGARTPNDHPAGVRRAAPVSRARATPYAEPSAPSRATSAASTTTTIVRDTPARSPSEMLESTLAQMSTSTPPCVRTRW